MRKLICTLFLAALGLTLQAQTQSQLAKEITNTLDTEWEVLRLTNIERVNNGQHILLATDMMQWMAGVRADELCTKYSHDRPNGSSFYTIMEDNSFAYSSSAENIANGYVSAQAVMTGWMNSTGHKANILSGSKLRLLGVGMSESNGRKNWVQLFACNSNSEASSVSVSSDGKFVVVKLNNGSVGYAPNDPSIYVTVNGKEVVNYPGLLNSSTGSASGSSSNSTTSTVNTNLNYNNGSSSNSGTTVNSNNSTSSKVDNKRWVKSK